MEELEACAAAGESIVAWLRNELTIEEKVTIVAWYRLRSLTRIHSADAEAKASKAKQDERG